MWYFICFLYVYCTAYHELLMIVWLIATDIISTIYLLFICLQCLTCNKHRHLYKNSTYTTVNSYYMHMLSTSITVTERPIICLNWRQLCRIKVIHYIPVIELQVTLIYNPRSLHANGCESSFRYLTPSVHK